MSENDRPDPDQILARIQSETEESPKGKLKIFLGYSAGVGKTYKMLQTAHSRINQGLDVVVGLVETHGRIETDALLEGLPIIPRLEVEYHGITISELDLDAILERRPDLVLVDELAHTNPSSFRHPKRFEDVREILDAGIDVYTTLNIQHIESYKDIVTQMTGIVVRETVPDRVLDEATEIELVDLPPVDLIQRFQEGKVYMGNQVQRALDNFFTQGNLIALREMALRRAAQRVDKEIQDYTQAKLIKPNWSVSGRIMVCVSGNRNIGERLVRTGRRLADEMKTSWIALFVDKGAIGDWESRSEREQALKTLAFAKTLGAETVILQGKLIAQTIVDYGFKNNVARMVVGKSIRSRWQELVFGSNTEEIIRLSGWIDVFVVREETPQEPAKPPTIFFLRKKYTPYLASVILAAIVTVLNSFLFRSVDPEVLLLLYLFPIVIVAAKWGQGPALFTTILSFLLFHPLFILIPKSGIINVPQYLEYIIIYLIVGVAISIIVNREHVQVEFLKTQAAHLANLYDFIRDLAAEADLSIISRSIVDHVKLVFNWDSIVLIPEAEKLVMRSASKGLNLDEKDFSIALWAYNQGVVAGMNTENLPTTKMQFLPFTTERGVVGVIGIRPTKQAPVGELQQDRFMQIFIDQAAWAIERALLPQFSV